MKFDESTLPRNGHSAETSEESTRQRVARSLLVDGPQTAATLAKRLDLTPAAVRRHLDALAEEEAVEQREPRTASTRGRGRPAKLFALTDQGRDGFEKKYDDLAVEALRFLSEVAGEEAVREFAERRAAFIKQGLDRIAASETDLSPAQVLANVFTANGYAASVRELPLINGHDAGEQLCQQHCPVAHVAQEFPELCEAETEAIAKLLGTHVQRLATIAHGDGVCTTHIPPGSSGPGEVSKKKEQVTT
ncbi:metalloregulator ArsR/SmtB family transcription factor [Nocardioides sp. NPDC006273]|uniref:helix-turn-helix transcriptional regulator n=1 Tax=Nocardioides sp. NPDC006273 TaxID=3155598 RepID=UPI0033AEEA44